jgi:exopolysaccharide biosynthesis protein
LLKNKELVEDLNDQFTAPRTSLGVDASGSKLILIIVDGRQPLYSEGVTIKEMADIMLEYGGENAINLDGGGSSTLVITDPKTGKVRVMNSPIDRYIPGNERYIANHLGLFIK